VVRVRVTEIDVPRKRIGLTMRKDSEAVSAPKGRSAEKPKPARSPKPKMAAPVAAQSQGAFGSALADAMKRQTKGS
jgi:uncharacterized protein